MSISTQSIKLLTLKQAASSLNNGEVGVIPSDTIYGLAARAHDKNAVKRFYSLKSRDHKPGTVIAASVEQLVELGVDERYLQKVAHLWPNPISIEIQLGPKLAYLHQSTGRQAFRVVADKALRKVLEETGPLVTSSANKPGLPSANTVKEAWNYFKNEVDFYVDAGDLSYRAPSTIAKITDNGIEVIRQGAVKIS